MLIFSIIVIIRIIFSMEFHTSKTKDGYWKLFWPNDTPTAQALAGTRGGKGKGKGSKGKNEANSDGARSRGGLKMPQNKGACLKCQRKDSMKA